MIDRKKNKIKYKLDSLIKMKVPDYSLPTDWKESKQKYIDFPHMNILKHVLRKQHWKHQHEMIKRQINHIAGTRKELYQKLLQNDETRTCYTRLTKEVNQK